MADERCAHLFVLSSGWELPIIFSNLLSIHQVDNQYILIDMIQHQGKLIVLILVLVTAFASTYSSCCDKCPRMFGPRILLKFEGFTNQELSTFYLTRTRSSDTIFAFVDTSNHTGMIHQFQVPRVWYVESDRLNWKEDIVVYEWDVKETNSCHCFKEGTVKLEYGGDFYNFHYEDANDVNNHPLIIRK